MADLQDFQVDIIPDQGSVTTNKKNESYYVEMPKNEVQYKIRLKNNGLAKCDAVVTIDGKNMGTFRINQHDQMLLERPSDVERRFTFFVGGSEGSKQGGYKPKDKNNGLVQVLFKPERIQKQPTSYCYRSRWYDGPRKPEHNDDDDDYDEDCDYDKEEKWDDDDYGAPEMMSKGITSVPSSTNSMRGGQDQRHSTVPKSKRMTNAPTRGYKEGMTALTGDSNQKFVTVATLDYDYNSEVTIYLRLVYREVRPKVEPLRSVGTKRTTKYPNPV